MPNMTARSVVLSVLLGAHPAYASASELIRLTADFGIKETTLRVALTRMVSAGDLIRSADGYRLSDRLLARQRRQDEAMRPQVRAWHGLLAHRHRDQRGRPTPEPGPHCEPPCTTSVLVSCARACGCGRTTSNLDLDRRDRRPGFGCCKARDDAPAELANQLWDLPGWARAGHRLLDEMAPAAEA